MSFFPVAPLSTCSTTYFPRSPLPSPRSRSQIKNNVRVTRRGAAERESKRCVIWNARREDDGRRSKVVCQRDGRGGTTGFLCQKLKVL